MIHFKGIALDSKWIKCYIYLVKIEYDEKK